MRQFFRMLLLALVLLTVALISALTTMEFAIHGREVAIPKLVGLSPGEAERAGTVLGLQVAVERQFYSADVPAGKIMTQMPPAGTRVRRGWSVRVAQSLGPLRVPIPDVTGGTERVAELKIRRRGLTLGSVARISLAESAQGLTKDMVIAQSPPANASGVAAPRISLLVGDDPAPVEYVMPNLTGQPLGSAIVALQDAGLKVGKVRALQLVSSDPPQPALNAALPASEPDPASMVVNQFPAAGQKVAVGAAVDFEVR